MSGYRQAGEDSRGKGTPIASSARKARKRGKSTRPSPGPSGNSHSNLSNLDSNSPIPEPYLALAPSPITLLPQSQGNLVLPSSFYRPKTPNFSHSYSYHGTSNITSAGSNIGVGASAGGSGSGSRIGVGVSGQSPSSSTIGLVNPGFNTGQYAAGLLAPPTIRPGGGSGSASGIGVGVSSHRPTEVGRRRSAERIVDERDRFGERLREISRASESRRSLEEEPMTGSRRGSQPLAAIGTGSGGVEAPRTAGSGVGGVVSGAGVSGTSGLGTARRRRTRVVGGQEGSQRRLTVTSREEGRAMGLARGASMRRFNVWDDVPESADPPPPFPFVTPSNNRQPPNFSPTPSSTGGPFASVVERQTGSMPQTHDSSTGAENVPPRSPPPSFEQAIGIVPLPTPPTTAQPPISAPSTRENRQLPSWPPVTCQRSDLPARVDRHSRGQSESREISRLTLPTPSNSGGLEASSGTLHPSSTSSPTSTHFVSAPSSPVSASLSESTDDHSHDLHYDFNRGQTGQSGGLNDEERVDRRMWNSDLLAGYTLEERVARELARRLRREESSLEVDNGVKRTGTVGAAESGEEGQDRSEVTIQDTSAQDQVVRQSARVALAVEDVDLAQKETEQAREARKDEDGGIEVKVEKDSVPEILTGKAKTHIVVDGRGATTALPSVEAGPSNRCTGIETNTTTTRHAILKQGGHIDPLVSSSTVKESNEDTGLGKSKDIGMDDQATPTEEKLPSTLTRSDEAPVFHEWAKDVSSRMDTEKVNRLGRDKSISSTMEQQSQEDDSMVRPDSTKTALVKNKEYGEGSSSTLNSTFTTAPTKVIDKNEVIEMSKPNENIIGNGQKDKLESKIVSDISDERQESERKPMAPPVSSLESDSKEAKSQPSNSSKNSVIATSLSVSSFTNISQTPETHALSSASIPLTLASTSQINTNAKSKAGQAPEYEKDADILVALPSPERKLSRDNAIRRASQSSLSSTPSSPGGGGEGLVTKSPRTSISRSPRKNLVELPIGPSASTSTSPVVVSSREGVEVGKEWLERGKRKEKESEMEKEKEEEVKSPLFSTSYNFGFGLDPVSSTLIEPNTKSQSPEQTSAQPISSDRVERQSMTGIEIQHKPQSSSRSSTSTQSTPNWSLNPDLKYVSKKLNLGLRPNSNLGINLDHNTSSNSTSSSTSLPPNREAALRRRESALNGSRLIRGDRGSKSLVLGTTRTTTVTPQVRGSAGTSRAGRLTTSTSASTSTSNSTSSPFAPIVSSKLANSEEVIPLTGPLIDLSEGPIEPPPINSTKIQDDPKIPPMMNQVERTKTSLDRIQVDDEELSDLARSSSDLLRLLELDQYLQVDIRSDMNSSHTESQQRFESQQQFGSSTPQQLSLPLKLRNVNTDTNTTPPSAQTTTSLSPSSMPLRPDNILSSPREANEIAGVTGTQRKSTLTSSSPSQSPSQSTSAKVIPDYSYRRQGSRPPPPAPPPSRSKFQLRPPPPPPPISSVKPPPPSSISIKQQPTPTPEPPPPPSSLLPPTRRTLGGSGSVISLTESSISSTSSVTDLPEKQLARRSSQQHLQQQQQQQQQQQPLQNQRLGGPRGPRGPRAPPPVPPRPWAKRFQAEGETEEAQREASDVINQKVEDRKIKTLPSSLRIDMRNNAGVGSTSRESNATSSSPGGSKSALQELQDSVRTPKGATPITSPSDQSILLGTTNPLSPSIPSTHRSNPSSSKSPVSTSIFTEWLHGRARPMADRASSDNSVMTTTTMRTPMSTSRLTTGAEMASGSVGPPRRGISSGTEEEALIPVEGESATSSQVRPSVSPLSRRGDRGRNQESSSSSSPPIATGPSVGMGMTMRMSPGASTSIQQRRRQQESNNNETEQVTVVHPTQPRSASARQLGEYTDVDLYVARLEGSGHEYEGLAHLTSFLGPAKSPAATPEALSTLLPGLIVVDSRRTTSAGKVKLKLSLLGARVGSCPICLSQFREGERGVILPECGHAAHETCARRWFREDERCMVCRVPLRA